MSEPIRRIMRELFPHHADGLPAWGPPRSFIDYANSRGVLAGVMSVDPRRFSWQDHLIEIDECWLQTGVLSSRLSLYFVLKVDGVRGRRGGDEQKFLLFREEPRENLAMIGTIVIRTKIGLLTAFLPGVGVSGGFAVNQAGIASDFPPAELNLLAGTLNENGTCMHGPALKFKLTRVTSKT